MKPSNLALAVLGDRLRWRSGLTAWLSACRAFSLTASVTPVMVGTALAWHEGFLSLARSFAALLGAVAIHLGTNLINDYYDYVKGTDSLDSIGGSKVIQMGLLSPGAVWWGAMLGFAIGSAIGLVLTYICGWPILAVGLLSVATGYFYTAPPLSLAYNAMGELAVFIFMGPVTVMGSYYVAALRFAWQPLVASLPMAFLVAAILHANNVRDIDSDLTNHKLTVANLLGRRAANIEMVLLDGAAYAATGIAVVTGALPWLALITSVTMIPAWSTLRIVLRETSPVQLDRAVLGCAKLHLVFGLLLVAAIVLNVNRTGVQAR